ncbi:MAG: MBOAT family protein [Paludibacteraceae bacterium]|nr:MBOAT family protein [Paludibacteraceae bacterium]
MLFNSLEFAIFLPIVFAIYWAIGYIHIRSELKIRLQNAFIVIASYVFYGWWDWRFLFLIGFTSFCSWVSGLLISGADSRNESLGILASVPSKVWMIANVVINLAILATFKYYDFFVTEFCGLFGLSSDGLLLKIILPVGISFYTFQALSYSIDVYRHKIQPTRDIISFFAFISFFPQLVAGPIERATNLLPQFLHERTFDYAQAVDGIRQMLWGLFKKIVVADNCATIVDQVWSTYDTQPASALLIASVLFTFQIYGDFSGYSDIAIGTAKLFGIKLMRNFSNPYFSRDIAEFWRRWHISLTTWFRDYVYIPLGGSRPEIPNGLKHPVAYKKLIVIRNTFVIFLLSGFWHGANWTFIVWGAYHAMLFLPLILLGKNRKYTNQVGTCEVQGDENMIRLRMLPTWREFIQICITFCFVVLGWIIFRAENIMQACEYAAALFDKGLFANPHLTLMKTAPFIVLLIIIEWAQRNKQHGFEINNSDLFKYRLVRYILFSIVFLGIIAFRGGVKAFIYFQF